MKLVGPCCRDLGKTWMRRQVMSSGSEDLRCPQGTWKESIPQQLCRTHRLGVAAHSASSRPPFGGTAQRASPSHRQPWGSEQVQEAPWGLDPSLRSGRPCGRAIQGAFSREEWTWSRPSLLSHQEPEPKGSRAAAPRGAEGALLSVGGRCKGQDRVGCAWCLGGSSLRLPALSPSAGPLPRTSSCKT